LVYQVGDQTTCCGEHAAKLATANGAPVEFVVHQVYQNETAATLALAEETEALVKQLATPVHCKVTGLTTLGGKNLKCSNEAAEMAQLVKAAMDTVTVSYKVGDKQCQCPVEAKELSEKVKADVVFLVNGEQTGCATQQRVTAARAKYRAALEALAKAHR
jgi:hypothetical protein